MQHIANVGMEPELAALFIVPSINENLPFRGFKKPAGQVNEGAFARAGLTYNRHRGTGGNVQREVCQHVFAAVGVAEGHVPELNIAFQRLPVFPLGMEHIAVPFNDFRSVRNLRLFIHQTRHTLNGSLQGDKLRNIGGGHLDWLKDAHGVGGKGGEGSNLQNMLRHHIAAPQQHDCHRHGGEKQNQRDIHGVQPGGADTRVMHGSCQLAEVFRALLLDAQGFCGFRTGNAFVKGAGNLGVDFAHLPVPVQNAVLEIAGQNGDGRHDENDHQRQLPVQQQHGSKRAQHIKQRPQNIRHIPRQHTRNAVGIAGDAGEHIAHGRDIIKRQRQGLQMGEKVSAQILANIHFNLHGVVAESHNRQRLRHNGKKIAKAVGKQSPQGVRLNKILNGIPLKQWQQHVNQGAKPVENKHTDKGFFVVGQHRKQPLPDFQIKGFCIFLFVKGRHYPFPPSSMSLRSSLLI